MKEDIFSEMPEAPEEQSDVPHTVHFEGVQAGLRKTKEGVLITLVIHPNDVPETLMRDWVGTRYMVAMAVIPDSGVMPEYEGTPTASVQREKTPAERAIASMSALCRLREFWAFINLHMYRYGAGPKHPIENEETCVWYVKDYCKIKSRSEFKTNPEARSRFELLRDEYLGARNEN